MDKQTNDENQHSDRNNLHGNPDDVPHFPVDEVDVVMKEKGSFPVLEFEYLGQEFSISIIKFAPKIPATAATFDPDANPKEELEKPGEYNLTWGISDQENKLHGRITGKLVHEASGFISFSAMNYGYKDEEGEVPQSEEEVPHVPGLIGESICQLLLQRKFKVWYSSLILMQGGMYMYKNIAKRGDIDVREPNPNLPTDKDSTNKRWMLTLAQVKR